jgi:hypothetical protein
MTVRLTVAVIATAYFPISHADVIATRLIEGYEFGGMRCEPRVEVKSVHIEQLGERGDPEPLRDIGVGICKRAGVPLYPTAAEAIGCGSPGVNVDGVVIIGEHGDYEKNEFGQQLYPRRRLFDSAVATMVAAGRTVPIFCDKHLAWSFKDARAMYDTARRVGIPLLAGSSIPLSWRVPIGSEWPFGEPMDALVGVGHGDIEAYGFHVLEAMQAHAERRAGGETGVVAVRGLSGTGAADAIERGDVDPGLLDKVLGALGLDPDQVERAKRSVKAVFMVEYADGLRGSAVICGEVVKGFGVACRGPRAEIANHFWLDRETFAHFPFLVRQIEALVLTGAAPYPVERSLLTGGILDAAMRSRSGDCDRRETPELVFRYEPAGFVSDTGAALPRP